MNQDVDRSRLARVLAVANGKGGVGKTSIATTLAGMAAEAGYQVLLIDLDPQGNAGEDLGYTGTGSSDDGAGLIKSVTTEQPLTPSLRAVRPRLDVVCGGELLDELSTYLASDDRDLVGVTDLLAQPLTALLTAEPYDLVIIDCPPGEPNLQLLALGAARWLIIPTRGDAASLKGMARIAQRLVQARTSNAELELLGVVLFDIPISATRLRRQTQQQIRQALRGVAPLFESTIRNSVTAADARARGQLIHEHAAALAGEPFWEALRAGRRPNSPGSAPSLAADYAALSHEILLRISSLESGSEQKIEETA